MKLANIGCGATRPPDPWINVDNLHAVLRPGTPERDNLDRESNYINADISVGLPFPNNHLDGILCSHVIEHFECNPAVNLLQEFRRTLKPDGVLLVSVPDASYFRKVYQEDNLENAQRLFGEPIYLPDCENTFMGYALFNRFHKQTFTEDSLWCHLVRAGFNNPVRFRNGAQSGSVLEMLSEKLNRPLFSLVFAATK